MEIKTERLTLLPIGSAYLESAFEYSSDRENTRLMVFLPHESMEETEKFLRECEKQWEAESPDFLELAILCGGVHIGAVTVYFLNGGKTAELGWILNTKYQKKGYITEAALAVMDYIKNDLGINRIIAQCDSENFASRRVMEKIGLTLVDTSGVRKNRSSDEERREFTYEVNFGDNA